MTGDGSATMAAVKAGTRAVYERRAGLWDRERNLELFEAPWLERFAGALPRGGRVLDLGCGSGRPIAGWLLQRGFRLTGIDYAAPMIALAQHHFPPADWPGARWLVRDMRDLPPGPLGDDDEPGTFDGVIGWDSYFHLSVAEQRAVLPALAQRVNPGGALLLTVGPAEGEVTGTVGGDIVYHASLSPAEYHATLRIAGFGDITFVPDDPTALGRSILLACRRSTV